MKRVRLLQSISFTLMNRTLHFNDEIDLEDNLADQLAKNGAVDILKVEKPVEKPKPRAKRTTKKEVAE